MKITNVEEIRELMRRARALPPAQRLVVLAYATADQLDGGTVWETGVELAESLGLSQQQFSQVRRKLIDAGWLEETHRNGNMRYYRLTEKASANGQSSNVVHLSRAS